MILVEALARKTAVENNKNVIVMCEEDSMTRQNEHEKFPEISTDQ